MHLKSFLLFIFLSFSRFWMWKGGDVKHVPVVIVLLFPVICLFIHILFILYARQWFFFSGQSINVLFFSFFYCNEIVYPNIFGWRRYRYTFDNTLTLRQLLIFFSQTAFILDILIHVFTHLISVPILTSTILLKKVEIQSASGSNLKEDGTYVLYNQDHVGIIKCSIFFSTFDLIVGQMDANED